LIFSSKNGNSNQLHQNQLGGKTFHLLKMKSAGFPVPEFLILTKDFVDKLIFPVRTEIEEIVNDLDPNDQIALVEKAKKIDSLLMLLDFPEKLLSTIYQKLESEFKDTQFFALRSSALAEDGAKSSFAGQHKTFLYVERNELANKILACIASAWGAGVINYRLKLELPLNKIDFALLIQEMVPAYKSGIGFSMNQSGNLNDAILVAGYGLGEGIVTDKTDADTYLINRQHQSIEKQLIEKNSGLFFDQEKGIHESIIKGNEVHESCLDDQQIKAVFEYLMKAEELIKKPSDIEFSFDKNNQLFILQMRPVTTIKMENLKILDNTNIVESYPGITLPLSYSFALEAYAKVFRGSSDAFLVSKKTTDSMPQVFDHLLEHYYGRVYYRLDNWYRLVSLVYSSEKSMRAWEKAVGLMETESDKVSFSFSNKLKTYFVAIRMILLYKKGNRQFLKIFKKNYNVLRNFQSLKKDPALLWKHYEDNTKSLFKPWYHTIVNDFLAFKAFGFLQDLSVKYGLSENENFANDLLTGIGEVESEIAMIKVLEFKKQINDNQELKKLFTRSPEEILEAADNNEYPFFFKEVFSHLDQYGDRTLAELKLESPSMRKNPLLFIRLLKNQLTTTVNVKDFRLKQKEIRETAQYKMNSKLKWWQFKKVVFKIIRNRAAYGLQNRENMRFCRTRAYSAIKDIFLEIGNMMNREGIIDQPKDIFYLHLDDLRKFCKDNHKEKHQEKIIGLKDLYKSYEDLNLPDRVIYMDENRPIYTEQNITNYSNQDFFKGIAVSRGIVKAKAAVIKNPEVDSDVKGKILVTKMTDPGWVFLMSQASGLLSEKGSLLSHTAIVGRELGIPAVVGIPGVSEILKSGEMLELDGGAGTIRRILDKTIENEG